MFGFLQSDLRGFFSWKVIELRKLCFCDENLCPTSPKRHGVEEDCLFMCVLVTTTWKVDGATPISLGLSSPPTLPPNLGVASHLLSLRCTGFLPTLQN